MIPTTWRYAPRGADRAVGCGRLLGAALHLIIGRKSNAGRQKKRAPGSPGALAVIAATLTPPLTNADSPCPAPGPGLRPARAYTLCPASTPYALLTSKTWMGRAQLCQFVLV